MATWITHTTSMHAAFLESICFALKNNHTTKYKGYLQKTGKPEPKKVCNQVSGLVSNVFPLCSPLSSPMGSHHVPNMFQMCSPTCSPYKHLTFYPHICFGKCCPPFTCIAVSKGRNSILQNRTFYFGVPPIVSFLFEWWWAN